MSRTVLMVDAVALTINCEQNDPVDINCGGPQYLGYDFCVSKEEYDSGIVKHIKKELKKNKQPLLSISDCKMEVEEQRLWSKEKIAECIKNGYE